MVILLGGAGPRFDHESAGIALGSYAKG